MWILIATQLMTSSAPPLPPAEAVKVLQGSHSIADRTDVVGWDPAPREVYTYAQDVRESLVDRNDLLWFGNSIRYPRYRQRLVDVRRGDAFRRGYHVGSMVRRSRVNAVDHQGLRRANGRIR
jgi:hypothetical protein